MAIRLRRQPTRTGWSDAGSLLLASALSVTSMPMPAGSPRAISSCWLALWFNGDVMVWNTQPSTIFQLHRARRVLTPSTKMFGEERLRPDFWRILGMDQLKICTNTPKIHQT